MELDKVLRERDHRDACEGDTNEKEQDDEMEKVVGRIVDCLNLSQVQQSLSSLKQDYDSYK